MNAQQKLSPFPWSFFVWTPLNEWMRRKDSVHIMARVSGEPNARRVYIAEVHGQNCDANARVMVVAPEMLETLQEIYAHIDAVGQASDETLKHWKDIIGEVVAKAEGGAK